MALRSLDVDVTRDPPKITEEDIEYALEARTKEILAMISSITRLTSVQNDTLNILSTEIIEKYGL